MIIFFALLLKVLAFSLVKAEITSNSLQSLTESILKSYFYFIPENCIALNINNDLQLGSLPKINADGNTDKKFRKYLSEETTCIFVVMNEISSQKDINEELDSVDYRINNIEKKYFILFTNQLKSIRWNKDYPLIGVEKIKDQTKWAIYHFHVGESQLINVWKEKTEFFMDTKRSNIVQKSKASKMFLKNGNFTISAFGFAPYLIRSRAGFSGAEVDVLKVILKKFGIKSYKFKNSKHQGFKNPRSGTWHGKIGDVQ